MAISYCHFLTTNQKIASNVFTVIRDLFPLQEFKVFGYLRQQWKDERLAGKLDKPITIKGENINRLWLPDPFCYNARDSNLMLPDSAVHSKVLVDTEGNVLYTKGSVHVLIL